MKPVISEEVLRIFVRSQIRKELNRKLINEQELIKVNQATGANTPEWKLEQCEIKIPEEFKAFIKEVNGGFEERAKISLFKRAARLGVNIDDTVKDAALRKGRFQPTKPLKDWARDKTGIDWALMGSPDRVWPENTIARGFRRIMDIFGGSLPGGNIGIKAADFPMIDFGSEYFFNQIEDFLGPQARQWMDENFKEHMDVLDPVTGRIKKVKVKADISWSKMSKKYEDQYRSLIKMIDGFALLAQKIIFYTGAPSILCTVIEKALKYFGKIMGYVYEPESSDEYGKIARKVGQEEEQNKINPGQGSSNFSIAKEIKRSASKVANNLGNSEIAQVYNSLRESKRKDIALHFKNFTQKAISTGIIDSEKDNLLDELSKDIEKIEKNIDDIRTATIGTDSMSVYNGLIGILQDIENLHTSRAVEINAVQSSDIKAGIVADYVLHTKQTAQLFKSFMESNAVLSSDTHELDPII